MTLPSISDKFFSLARVRLYGKLALVTMFLLRVVGLRLHERLVHSSEANNATAIASTSVVVVTFEIGDV
eukprot:673002-Pleurochrysis_carterae.AAC.1